LTSEPVEDQDFFRWIVEVAQEIVGGCRSRVDWTPLLQPGEIHHFCFRCDTSKFLNLELVFWAWEYPIFGCLAADILVRPYDLAIDLVFNFFPSMEVDLFGNELMDVGGIDSQSSSTQCC